MRKTLLLCSALIVTVCDAALTVVYVAYDYASGFFDPVKALTLTDPAPERHDLIEHGMPQQDAPTQRTVKATTDQRPWLDRFTRLQHQPSFALH